MDPMLVPAMDRRMRVVDSEAGKRQGIRAGLTANVLTARATIAAAMQILMLAGQKREVAAREVASILKSNSVLANCKGEPWRVVARWREEIMAQAQKRELPDIDSGADYRVRAVGQFNSVVSITTRMFEAGSITCVDLVRIAHAQLDHGLGISRFGNSGLAPANPECSER